MLNLPIFKQSLPNSSQNHKDVCFIHTRFVKQKINHKFCTSSDTSSWIFYLISSYPLFSQTPWYLSPVLSLSLLRFPLFSWSCLQSLNVLIVLFTGLQHNKNRTPEENTNTRNLMSVMTSIICQTIVTLLGASPILFFVQSNTVKYFCIMGSPKIIYLLSDCLMFRVTFFFADSRTISWIQTDTDISPISRINFFLSKSLILMLHTKKPSARREQPEFSIMIKALSSLSGREMQLADRVNTASTSHPNFLGFQTFGVQSRISATTGNLAESRLNHSIPLQPVSEFLTERSPIVTIGFYFPKKTVTYRSAASTNAKHSSKNDFQDYSSNLKDSAPSARLDVCWVILVALRKLVWLSFISSFSSDRNSPMRKILQIEKNLPQSLVVNSISSDFSRIPEIGSIP